MSRDYPLHDKPSLGIILNDANESGFFFILDINLVMIEQILIYLVKCETPQSRRRRDYFTG